MPLGGYFETHVTERVCEVCQQKFQTRARFKATICQKESCRLARKREVNARSRARIEARKGKVHA